jgi:hypothetical protein
VPRSNFIRNRAQDKLYLDSFLLNIKWHLHNWVLHLIENSSFTILFLPQPLLPSFHDIFLLPSVNYYGPRLYSFYLFLTHCLRRTSNSHHHYAFINPRARSRTRLPSNVSNSNSRLRCHNQPSQSNNLRSRMGNPYYLARQPENREHNSHLNRRSRS